MCFSFLHAYYKNFHFLHSHKKNKKFLFLRHEKRGAELNQPLLCSSLYLSILSCRSGLSSNNSSNIDQYSGNNSYRLSTLRVIGSGGFI